MRDLDVMLLCGGIFLCNLIFSSISVVYFTDVWWHQNTLFMWNFAHTYASKNTEMVYWLNLIISANKMCCLSKSQLHHYLVILKSEGVVQITICDYFGYQLYPFQLFSEPYSSFTLKKIVYTVIWDKQAMDSSAHHIISILKEQQ